MITIFNKLNFSKQHPVLIENFDQLRERLLDWLLVLSVLLMIPSSILMIMRSFSLGWTLNSFLQLIIYACFMILVWQRRRIPYNWRSYLMIGLWWLSCTIGLFLIGPAGEAKAMFIVLTLITMLLLPVRFGWLMVGLIALTINVVGIMVIWYGWKFTINYQLFINDPLSWLFASYHLSVFAGLSAYVVWQMVHALQISLEQSQAQREQLQTALARQQAIFASNNAAIAVIRNRTFIEVNEYLAHFFGYQTAELVGQPTRLVYLNDEHYETFGQQLYQSLLDHQHYATEFQFRHKNGLPIWTYISVSKLQTTAQGVEVAMLAIDISKRKQMEESLRTAEQFAHATVNALSAHLCVLDEHGTILTVNRAWRKFAQLNPPMSTHYAEGTNYLDICDNAANNDKILEAAMMANGIRAILQGRRENFSIEYACHSPTEQRWFIANVNRFSEGGPARVVVTHENITEHKCAEIALKTSEERYRSLIIAMSEGVVMQNQQGKIITCNAAAERILGLTQDQMIGRTALDPRWRAIREDGSDFPGEIHPASIALRTGKPQHGVIMGVHKPNSQLSWILINAEPLFQEDKTKPHAVVATFSDITEARIVKLQIEEQRRTLQTVLDNIPVAVQVFAAPSATVILANQQAQKLLGRPVACDAPLDDLNQTYGAFIDGTDTLYPPEKMPLVRGFAGETTMVEDMELRRLDGSRILLQVFGAPIRDDTGQVTASVVIFQDVTERKRAEENIKANEQRLRRLGDNLPSGAIYQVVHTSQGQVYFPYISAGIERIFGVSAQEIIANAWSLYRLIESEDLPMVLAKELESARNLQPFNHIFRQHTVNGELRWVHCRSMPEQKEDGSLWWDGVILDITAQKQIEEELIRAREVAEVANQAKSAFLANMSHELRTPLNAVLGFAQILSRDLTLTPQQQNQIQSIRRGGEYLLTLINDILDLAKIEAGRFELIPETWNTEGFFRELEQMFRIRAEQKGILFHCETVGQLPYTLHCDDKRLRQILINLLGNAVKFTLQGQVTLRNYFENNHLYLEVIDTGIGIAATEIEKIFDPFQQTGESSYKAQGTGLGLAITRRLVEAMQGKLTVNSILGKGSLFQVIVPAEVVSSLSEAQPSVEQPLVVGYHRTQGIGALRVLITDDITDNRQVLTDLLKPLGFEVAEAKDGRHCLEIAVDWQPDVILMDLRMPELDGLEATRRLRTFPSLQTTPVIAISASAFFSDRELSLAAGCNEHLDKPIRLMELLETLEKLLPLKWDYAQAIHSEEPSNPECSASCENLPLEQGIYFQHLVKCGDMTSLQEFAEQLEESACCPVFTKKLSLLIKKFDLKGLKKLAECH